MMTNRNSPLQQETFAFLDIETTGGNPQRDRITEIGIRFWRAGEVVGEWQTLLNPETRISGFIERLTGITNAMVADAPLFADIADELEQQLQGKVFVAQNARFDYGFITSLPNYSPGCPMARGFTGFTVTTMCCCTLAKAPT